MTQQKLLYQINNEENPNLKYFFLKQYLIKYEFILESDSSETENGHYIYFLYENDVWFLDYDMIKNLDKSNVFYEYGTLLSQHNINNWIRGKFVKRKNFKNYEILKFYLYE